MSNEPLTRDFNEYMEMITPKNLDREAELKFQELLKSAFNAGALCMWGYDRLERQEAMQELREWQIEMQAKVNEVMGRQVDPNAVKH